MNLQSLPIKTRLSLCFAIILAFIVIISGLAFVGINKQAKASNDFVEHDVSQVLLVSELVSTLEEQDPANMIKLVAHIAGTEKATKNLLRHSRSSDLGKQVRKFIF